jgi:hypothetical protein
MHRYVGITGALSKGRVGRPNAAAEGHQKEDGTYLGSRCTSIGQGRTRSSQHTRSEAFVGGAGGRIWVAEKELNRC